MPRIKMLKGTDTETQIDAAVRKLARLGVFPDTVRESAEMFSKCRTIDGVKGAAREMRLSAGGEQFVYFHLEAIINSDSEFRTRFLDEASDRLRGTGIDALRIVEYFRSGADPGLVFTLRYGQTYNNEIRNAFYEKADQFALDSIRRWLGFMPAG